MALSVLLAGVLLASPPKSHKPQTPCEVAADACKKHGPKSPACAQARKRCEDSQRVA